ncbi:MAG: hypothetical protein RDV48_14115 [Candidatus Eremiobacteraeota bacterium]|nr:hypothetical protein [Candidatus Eremiobacteraeota bacterium]
MGRVVEVVIYDVNTRRKEDFDQMMNQWVQYLSQQPGFISSSYLQSLEKPRIHVQILEFEDKQMALQILDNYRMHVGEERFSEFFKILNRRPAIEYYKKIEFR